MSNKILRTPINILEIDAIKEVLPEYFATDYPTLVAFLEAYYEYMNQEGEFSEVIDDLKGLRDVSTTDLQYIDNILEEVGLGIAGDFFDNPREIVKNFARYFRIKGSEYSIEGFFRAFFDTHMEFHYPKEDIFTIGDPESKIGPDSKKYIQNGKSLQILSILLSSEISIAKWGNLYKKYVHPAGIYLYHNMWINTKKNVDIRPMPVLPEIDNDLHTESKVEFDYRSLVDKPGKSPIGNTDTYLSSAISNTRRADEWKLLGPGCDSYETGSLLGINDPSVNNGEMDYLELWGPSYEEYNTSTAVYGTGRDNVLDSSISVRFWESMHNNIAPTDLTIVAEMFEDDYDYLSEELMTDRICHIDSIGYEDTMIIGNISRYEIGDEGNNAIAPIYLKPGISPPYTPSYPTVSGMATKSWLDERDYLASIDSSDPFYNPGLSYSEWYGSPIRFYSQSSLDNYSNNTNWNYFNGNEIGIKYTKNESQIERVNKGGSTIDLGTRTKTIYYTGLSLPAVDANNTIPYESPPIAKDIFIDEAAVQYFSSSTSIPSNWGSRFDKVTTNSNGQSQNFQILLPVDFADSDHDIFITRMYYLAHETTTSYQTNENRFEIHINNKNTLTNSTFTQGNIRDANGMTLSDDWFVTQVWPDGNNITGSLTVFPGLTPAEWTYSTGGGSPVTYRNQVDAAVVFTIVKVRKNKYIWDLVKYDDVRYNPGNFDLKHNKSIKNMTLQELIDEQLYGITQVY